MEKKGYKYSPEIVDNICELIEHDTFTIEEITKRVGINRATFYQWKKDYPDFVERIKDAEKRRRASFATYAERSLLKKIQGYKITEVSEVKTRTGETETRTTTKEVAPDTTAIIFALTSLKPDVYKNRQTVDTKQEIDMPKFKGFKSVLPDTLPDEELDKAIEERRKAFFARYSDEMTPNRPKGSA